MTERKAIRIENALIVLSIAALWPAILRFDPRVSWPALIIALALMVVINIRRWKRLLRLREERRKALLSPRGAGREGENPCAEDKNG